MTMWQHRAVSRGHESSCLAAVPLCNSVACVTPWTWWGEDAGWRWCLGWGWVCVWEGRYPRVCDEGRCGDGVLQLSTGASRVIPGCDQP